MNALQLYQAGRLEEAIRTLSAALRDNPTDVRQRTFLFELLCFAGEYDRAEKQLDIVAQGSHDAEMGAFLYRSALHAERTRQQMFEAQAGVQDTAEPGTVAGKLNGRPFTSIRDADARIGARLEVFAAGQYTWIPFAHLASLRTEPPKRLRDLMWFPATIRGSEQFRDFDFGEILVPALAPLSWRHGDDEVRLGRVTDWQQLPDGSEAPVGQKMLQVDDDLIPILEVRELEIFSDQQ